MPFNRQFVLGIIRQAKTGDQIIKVLELVADEYKEHTRTAETPNLV